MYGSVINKGKLPENEGERPSILIICLFICGVEFCERTCYYTINGTQTYFLESLGWDLTAATSATVCMSAACYFFPLLMCYISDIHLGRYGTVILGTSVYLCGCLLIVIAAVPAVDIAILYLFGTLCFIPIGTAGIKTCLSVFGADQFDDPLIQEQYFQWFFAAINGGAFLAYAFFVNFANNGGLGVSKEYAYCAAYTIAAIFMVIALVIFLCGRRYYKIAPILGNCTMVQTIEVLVESARSVSWKAGAVLAAFIATVVAILLSVVEDIDSTSYAIYFAIPFIAGGAIVFLYFCPQPDLFMIDSTECRAVIKVIPLIFSGVLSGLMAQSVCSTWFANQACQMDCRFFGIQLSGSFFAVADCIAIVVGTPIIMKCVNPYVEYISGRKLTYSVKIYIAVGFSTAAMGSAVVLEYLRRDAADTGIVSNCAPSGVTMKAIAAEWMIIPYALTGISEVYAMPTLFFMSYDLCPASTNIFTMVLVLLMLSVVMMVITLVDTIFEDNLTNDLDNGHLEYVYYACTGVSLIFALLFWWADRRAGFVVSE